MVAFERIVARPSVSEPASPASVAPLVRKARAIRVVLVEPDAEYRVELGSQLWRRGFDVRGFADAASLLASPAAAVRADIIVASWGMPGIAGRELYLRLRRSAIGTPVLLLAGRVLAGRECAAIEPDGGGVVAGLRGIEALAAHLRRAARPSAFP